MRQTPSFEAVFHRLKPLLGNIPGANVTVDTPQDYALETPFAPQYRRRLFLGAVQVKKNYVSFHLMPVYIFPELLEGLSPALRKHMQGKSCFYFKSIDETLIAELEELTTRALERMRSAGLLP
jgi:hypothetical protein